MKNNFFFPSGFENPQYIYEMLDPRDGLVRYIGKTNNPKRRFSDHLRLARKNTKTRKASWIKGLLKLELTPVYRIIAITNEANVNKLEIKYIAEYRKKHDLYNMTDGGDGISKWSIEMRERMSKTLKGRKTVPCSEETKRKISLAQIGKLRPNVKWSSSRYDVMCKKVIGTTPDGIDICFKSLIDAARYVNTSSTSAIKRCCENVAKYHTVKKFKWRYA
jgi:hypothetical protein